MNLRNSTPIVIVLSAACLWTQRVHSQTPLPEPPPAAKTPPAANATPTQQSIDTVPHEESLPSDLPEFIEPPADPAAAKQIEEALHGASSVPIPGGVLGDVIEIIQMRGSVLDGSSLDPRLLTPPHEASTPVERASTQTRSASVVTAESLLRAARRLESLSPPVARRKQPNSDLLPIPELVRQMRIQATRLLNNEFPQAIQ